MPFPDTKEGETRCTCGEPHISDKVIHCYNGKPCYLKPIDKPDFAEVDIKKPERTKGWYKVYSLLIYSLKSKNPKMGNPEGVAYHTLDRILHEATLKEREACAKIVEKEKETIDLYFFCSYCKKSLEFGASTREGMRRGCYSKNCPRVKANNYFNITLPSETWAQLEERKYLLERISTAIRNRK